MILATLADLKTSDGSPTKEIVLLREQRPVHWLRAHGYRLLSKIANRSLPPELWHHTANFLEAHRGPYTWHAVIVTAFEDLTGNDIVTVALEQVSLPMSRLCRYKEDVPYYEDGLRNYQSILLGHPTFVFLKKPTIWKVPFPLQHPNPYQLYQGLNAGDVVRHLHQGNCLVCQGSREICKWPFSGSKKCHLHVACPSCMGAEPYNSDCELAHAFKDGTATTSDFEARAQTHNDTLRNLGYEAIEWVHSKWTAAGCTPCEFGKDCWAINSDGVAAADAGNDGQGHYDDSEERLLDEDQTTVECLIAKSLLFTNLY
ncbi:hypothetical protein CALVIDRAFT_100563 [Calocera viscosa TUFC12733]|uniref:Uncharacterized protein n=1 Tax=Calocera viscosa (strain TUFC12733) TaxID=1330018 RepID=A0A167ML51_CALVF|nr:hypothetical protein CALVIDRAFT_100563 [Calocera viscosa TUFC12733]